MTGLGHALTLALMHFVWQGALVALALWIVLAILWNHSANARYLTCCAAMALMVALPAITAWNLHEARSTVARGGATISTAAIPDGASSAALTRLARASSTNWTATAQVWVLPLWAMGVAVFALRMAWGCAQVAKLRRGGTPADPALFDLARRLAQRMGLDRALRVMVSDGTGGPSVVGWLRPVILLPASAIAGLSVEQLEAVLAHELAHIRRYDSLVNLAQMAVETVLFYHPAVWWVSRRMRHERELCCDDLALRTCADPVCYARALTTLERLRLASAVAAPGAVDGSLRYRIERIAGVSRQEYGGLRGAGMLAVALAIAGIALGWHTARAQQPPATDYLKRGDVLLREGRNDDAIRMYATGEQQDTDHRSTYQKRIIEALMRQNKRAEAAEVGQQLLKEHPTDTDGLGLQAMFLVDAGKTQEAIDALTPLVKQVPDNPVLHYNLARAYASVKQYDAAAGEFNIAIKLRPDYNMAVLAYANLLIEQNGYGSPAESMAEARRLLEPLRAGDPPSIEAWTELAVLDQRAGNYETAAEEFLKIYQLQPGNEQGLRQAAMALIEAKQPDRAIDLVRAETLKNPDRLDLVMDLGAVAARAGQIEIAVEAYHQMTSSSNLQERAAGYYQLALLYSSKADWQNALDSVDQVIQLQPSNQNARNMRDRIQRHEKPPGK